MYFLLAFKKRPAVKPERRETPDVPPSAFRLPPSAFRLPPSAFRLPPSVFRLPSSVFRLPSSVFRLLVFLLSVGLVCWRQPTMVASPPPGLADSLSTPALRSGLIQLKIARIDGSNSVFLCLPSRPTPANPHPQPIILLLHPGGFTSGSVFRSPDFPPRLSSYLLVGKPSQHSDRLAMRGLSGTSDFPD